MMKWIVGVLLALAAAWSVPTFADEAEVNADVFYQTAVELQKKGMGAMFDKRTKPMMRQMKAAGQAAKDENEAATARGKPVYCVPQAARKKGIGADQVIAMLGKVPAERRKRLTLKQAWREALIREYPCH